MQEKSKIIDSFKNLQDLLSTLSAKGVTKVDKEGRIFIDFASANELSDQAKKLGFAVKLVNTNADQAEVQFRSLIKLDRIAPDFNATNVDFIAFSDECETD